MFNYYGSKFKVSKFYPSPLHDLIIEPFAGAASYSVLHRHKKVFLNDSYKTIADIWRWLIEEATQNEIMENCHFTDGQSIKDLNLKIPHKNLIGFCINRGSAAPRNIVQRWSCQSKLDPDLASSTKYRLLEIAKTIKHIKHWSVQCDDFKSLPNVRATWFIDPPYQHGGEHYVENKINYNELAHWAKSRMGQVIVCENLSANWLEFQPLRMNQGQRKKSTEAIFYQIDGKEIKEFSEYYRGQLEFREMEAGESVN